MKKSYLSILSMLLVCSLGFSSCDSFTGEKGATGNGIASIEKTKTTGLVDEYTITFTNGTKTTFTVTNGANGARGLDGIDGTKGEQGEPGAKGDQGEQGIQGEKGDQGDQGIQGEPGAKGDQGEQGIQGEKGDQGEQGIQGEKGDQGDTGATGAKGDNGKSAFEIYKEYYPLFKGTEEDWINAIITNDKCALTLHYDHYIEDVSKLPTLEEEGQLDYTCKDCSEFAKSISIPKIVASNAQIYQEESKSYINYGYYPQTVVVDNNIISALNEITEVDDNGYKTYNNEKYYEYTNTNTYTAKDSSTVEAGSHYYKVEPIKWMVMEQETGKVCLFSAYILDYKQYNNRGDAQLKETTDYQNHTASAFSNNYKYSTIRTWLNTTFLETAFENDSSIYITEVDNSADSTCVSNNPNVCENTNDKVFLMSRKELVNTYGSISKKTTYTDFAKAQGVDEKNYHGFTTRSPREGNSGGTHTYCFNEFGGNEVVNYNTTFTFGIRPAIYLAIKVNNEE